MSLLARLMGFGHRVYKTFDPRSKIMKQICDELLEAYGVRCGAATVMLWVRGLGPWVASTLRHRP